MTAINDEPVEKGKLNRIRSVVISAYSAKALAIITTPITTHLLGPEGRGQLAAATVLSTFAVATATAGFGFGISHDLANGTATDRELFGATLKYTVVLLIPCLLLGVLLYVPPMNNAPTATREATLFLLWITPLTAIGNAGIGIFTARDDLKRIALLRLLPVVAASIVLVALALTGTLTPATAIFAYATSILASTILSLIYLKLRPVWTHSIKPLLHFTGRSIPAQLALMTNRSLDQLLVAPLLGFRELGFYSLSVVISSIPISVSYAVSMRSFSHMGTRADFDGVACARFTRLAGLILIGLCILIAVPSPYFIPIVFGSQFAESTLPLLLLLPGTIMLGMAQPSDMAFTLLGRPGTASIIELITLVFTVVGLAFGLHFWGIAGAAIVSSVSYALRFLMARHVLRDYGLGRVIPKVSEWRDAIRLVVVD